MTMAIGMEITGNAVEGSVLFVGASGALELLAQDNAGFYFDQDNNALKSANAGRRRSFGELHGFKRRRGTGQLRLAPAGNSGDLC